MTSLNINIRFAKETECALLVDFIKELAIYEKRLASVKATEENIYDIVFKRNIGQAIIAEANNEPVGFALFFYNISTFEGKCGIYIEDMYVKEKMRNKSIGKSMFSFIARYAINNGCSRLEWTVLKWNKPSINFYKKIGAEPKNEWDIYKLSGNALERLAWK
ncbi:MAG: GNAT family N-acetyltransferase [Actinobacteria bacterium]|nr:GNAT family N-acetyltransferase [Actinomycetota bacterium]